MFCVSIDGELVAVFGLKDLLGPDPSKLSTSSRSDQLKSQSLAAITKRLSSPSPDYSVFQRATFALDAAQAISKSTLEKCSSPRRASLCSVEMVPMTQ
jgi:hypothetical protein